MCHSRDAWPVEIIYWRNRSLAVFGSDGCRMGIYRIKSQFVTAFLIAWQFQGHHRVTIYLAKSIDGVVENEFSLFLQKTVGASYHSCGVGYSQSSDAEDGIAALLIIVIAILLDTFTYSIDGSFHQVVCRNHVIGGIATGGYAQAKYVRGVWNLLLATEVIVA